MKENTQPGVPIVLIGGRCDLKKENDDDCVDYLDAKVGNIRHDNH